MNEHEYIDFEETVHELLYDIIHLDPLAFSSPEFHEATTDDIFDLFYAEWLDADLISGDDDPISELLFGAIVEHADSFFQLHFQPRSSPDTYVKTSPLNIETKLCHLSNLPQPTQKTLEWHQYRHELMTASNIWKVFASDSQRNSLIYEKCKPFSAENKGNWHSTGSLQWGVLYEPLSILLYETIFKTKVRDYGCIQHPQYKCIGASPDGINVCPDSERYGRMLEVKNIVNREITGIPKEEYWIQMHLQMETCDIDDCDFLETRFKEYATEEEFHGDVSREWKGIILCFIQRNLLNSKPTYRYSPLGVAYDVATWTAETREAVKAEDLVLFSTTHWYLDQLSCVYVQRNRTWFSGALPQILDTWTTIERERETGYEHRAAAKRVTDIFISTDGGVDTHLIHNMKIPPSICLVKLE